MSATKRSLKNTANTAGALVIIRPSELAKAGTTGVVATGVYEGAKPNKFNAAKSDYFVRSTDGTLYIINGCKSIDEQLTQLTAEDAATVEVEYNGKLTTKSGKGFHDFNVSVIG